MNFISSVGRERERQILKLFVCSPIASMKTENKNKNSEESDARGKQKNLKQRSRRLDISRVYWAFKLSQVESRECRSSNDQNLNRNFKCSDRIFVFPTQ